MSILSAVNQKFYAWGGRLRESAVGRFWFWWIAELRDLLPARWREKLVAESRVLEVRAVETGFQFHADTDRQLTIPADSEAELAQQQLGQLLEDAELENPEKVLVLPAMDVLQTRVSLPLAAEARLRQALEFDLDRQTPFRHSDVYFDYRILDRDREHNQIRLQLYLVPRAQVDPSIRSLHQMGVDLNRMIPEGLAPEQTTTLNLLPLAMRARRVNRKARFNWLVAGIVLLLLLATMFQALHVREERIQALEEAIVDVSKEARLVSSMREQIEDAREAAGFLAERGSEYPEDIQVIAELTRILPVDTWVQRLIIKDGEVRIQGLSKQAQRLIGDLNDSPYFSGAAFLGTTQFDSRANRERYNLSAKLVNLEQLKAAQAVSGVTAQKPADKTDGQTAGKQAAEQKKAAQKTTGGED